MAGIVSNFGCDLAACIHVFPSDVESGATRFGTRHWHDTCDLGIDELVLGDAFPSVLIVNLSRKSKFNRILRKRGKLIEKKR